MRLVQKVSLAFMIGSSTILAANGYFRVRREMTVFEADRVRDHDLIGRALGASIAEVWRSEGKEAALQLLQAANAGEGKIRFRWVWSSGPERSPDLHVDPETLARAADGTTITRIAATDRGIPERFTYAIERLHERRGALELSEKLDAERAFAHRTLVDTAQTTAVLALVTAVLSYLLGWWLIGGPVGALVEKARRIGRGDFGVPVRLRSRDELSELALELNTTSEAIVRANDEVKRETREKIAALEQLRHADRLATVGKLASGVAHELGTPLNVVLARAQMIATGEVSQGAACEYGRVIVDATERMTRIIRQLLEFARRRGPSKELCDIVAVAHHGIELLRPLAQRRNIVLSLDAGNSLCETRVDPALVEQALTNLIVNAVQATPDGGEVEVQVRLERAKPPPDHGGAEGDWVVVRVSDAGRGIAPEHLPRIFEPFFTTKDIGEGTGLGLSVTFGIVQDHRGWIDVQSELGKGATFALYLPIKADLSA